MPQTDPMKTARHPFHRIRLWLAGLAAGISFLFFFHTYGINLLPGPYVDISPQAIRPWSAGTPSVAYAFDFSGSEPDAPFYRASRIELYEDGLLLSSGHAIAEGIAQTGMGYWVHQPGQVVFSSSDNTDPRTNGRTYSVGYPWLHRLWIGRLACLALVLSIVLLWRWHGPAPALAPASLAPPVNHRFRLHLGGAVLVFALGLYLETGTLTPYAITSLPRPEPPHGYLYNSDHPHFQVLYKFVDGQDRSQWNGALLFRRILFPVFAYPFMKAWGFNIGGTVASLVLNLAVFLLFVRFVRRKIGPRGAILAGWLLAFYPGAAYWAGLPYFYAAIVPCSLLLTMGLWKLREAEQWRILAAVSLLMGVTYLAYDLIVFFLPASLLVLVWRRRWLWTGAALALQVLPLAAWLYFLQHGLKQNLANSNTDAISSFVRAYLSHHDYAQWKLLLPPVPDITLDVFFSANFIFLPAAFVALLAVNAVTSRIGFTSVETGLSLAALALCLFINLAPPYNAGWIMRGNWVARMYQPVFPVFLLFAARWQEALPALPRRMRVALAAGGLFFAGGNALVIFGPILENPGRISEEAFYRFYDIPIQSGRPNYDRNLTQFGARPLGF